jgi:hypothetical protein
MKCNELLWYIYNMPGNKLITIKYNEYTLLLFDNILQFELPVFIHVKWS